MAQATMTVTVRVRWPLLCAGLMSMGLARLAWWLCVVVE